MILRFLKTCSSLKYQKAVLKFIFQTAFFMSIFGVNVFAQTAAKNTPPVFKLHVVKEPLQFDPALLTSGNGQFLFGQIFANLYRYDQDLQWTADLATKCYVSKNGKLLTCILFFILAFFLAAKTWQISGCNQRFPNLRENRR